MISAGGATTAPEMEQGQVRDAIWLGRRPKNIDFGCYHSECNPYKHLSAYVVRRFTAAIVRASSLPSNR